MRGRKSSRTLAAKGWRSDSGLRRSDFFGGFFGLLSFFRGCPFVVFRVVAVFLARAEVFAGLLAAHFILGSFDFARVSRRGDVVAQLLALGLLALRLGDVFRDGGSL